MITGKKGRSADTARQARTIVRTEHRGIPQLRRRFELRDGTQFFECRRERIGKTSDRAWPERLEVALHSIDGDREGVDQ